MKSSSKFFISLFTIAIQMIVFYKISYSEEFVVPIKEGQELPQANAALLAQGWKPQETGDAEGLAGLLYTNGYPGVESCGDSYMSPCVFNYVDEKGNCLRVVTLGGYWEDLFPIVDSWSFRCPGKGSEGNE